jgi:hypothetical protein
MAVINGTGSSEGTTDADAANATQFRILRSNSNVGE